MRSLIKHTLIPPIIPTLAWYDPADPGSLTVASGLCSQMNDKSGNARHVTASGLNRPTSGTDTIGTLNALGFETAPAFMGTAGGVATQAQPLTYLAVARRVNTLSAYGLVIGDSNNSPALFGGPTGVWGYYAGTLVTSAITVDTAAHVIAGVFNGASSHLDLDGAQISSGNPGTTGLTSTSSICIGNNGSVVSNWPGCVGEVLIYASALSAGDYADAAAYLKAKWGTP